MSESEVMRYMKRHKLIELRGNRSRRDVSEFFGITPQGLGMIERGERTPKLTLAKKMADFYGVAIEDIFFTENRHKTFPKNNSA